MHFKKKIGFIFEMMLVCTLICNQGSAQNSEQQIKESKRLLPIYLPLAVKDMKCISSAYGYRIHPVLKKLKKHSGIDLAAKEGKPVYATADGVVERVDYDNGYGNLVLVKHKENIKTLYAHLKYQMVLVGQKINRGTIIGAVGQTGMTTGPHLHYEIWVYDVKIDPMTVWNNTLKNKY